MSAKVIIKQQDRSAIIPSLAGIEIGTVINSDWGPITPSLNTDPTKLVNKYAEPNNAKGSSWNGAELLLSSSNKVWITRAIHDDAKYSASLLSFKVTATNFNDFPAPNATVDTVVKEVVGGIGLDELDSYTFPLYSTDRVYVDTLAKVPYDNADTTLEVSSLEKQPGVLFTSGDKIAVVAESTVPAQNTDFYTIVSAADIQVAEKIITINSPITASAGTEVFHYTGSTESSYVPPIFLVYDVTASTILVVTSSDAAITSDVIHIGVSGPSKIVSSKSLVNRTAHILTLDSAITADKTNLVFWMKEDETEYRDIYLATAIYPGARGDRIKLGVRPSVNYPIIFFPNTTIPIPSTINPGQAVILDVYFDGVLEESFEITRDLFKDGFGNQMEALTRVNGVSNYIRLKKNSADDSGLLPLPTSTGVWRRNPTDIFNPVVITTTNTVTVEDLILGDTLVTLNSVATLSNQDRIKFEISTGPLVLSHEYKILSISGTTITLDRPLKETTITDPAKLYKLNATQQDHNNGIYGGVQYYKFTQIPYQTGYSISNQYTISGITGTLLDCGTNNILDGSDGSALTSFDIINAFNKMSNKEKYKIALFIDNGYNDISISQAIDAICQHTNLSHGYLSVPYTAGISNDPVAASVTHRNSLNLNTAYSSLFDCWIKVADTYNQTNVWVAPSIFGALTQSFVTKNYYIFTPAAGWVYGVISGLEINVQYDEGQRDILVASQINPIRFREGMGLALWGNETLYVKPSPLQLRSVAMLLIVLKYGLENYLEFKLFANNNQPTWTEIEDALNIFIRDTLFTPGGLYGWQVKVTDIITDTDIDNRKCPVFVGIQPTMDIQTIPVTLGIFNKSVNISF